MVNRDLEIKEIMDHSYKSFQNGKRKWKKNLDRNRWAGRVLLSVRHCALIIRMRTNL